MIRYAQIYFLAVVLAVQLFNPLKISQAYTPSGTWIVTLDCPTISDCISSANSGDTILIPAGTYTESLVISKTLSIRGLNTLKPTIHAAQDSRVIELLKGELHINNLTISGGTIGNLGHGSGILIHKESLLFLESVIVKNNQFINASLSSDGGETVSNGGTLTIWDSVIENNKAGSEGAITNYGLLTVINTSIKENQAIGIHNRGIALIRNSTISGNISNPGDEVTSGGGILNHGQMTLENVTISENSAYLGAGLFNGSGYTMPSKLSAINVTIYNNSAYFGDGIYLEFGQVTLKNSLISNNHRHYDCLLAPNSILLEGINWIADSTCNSTFSGDPKLGFFDNHGGINTANGEPPYTVSLLPESLAIDRASCLAEIITDERGIPRPQGRGCDLGAYEFIWSNRIYLPLIQTQH